VEPRVDVDTNELGRPFQGICMEAGRERRTTGGPPAIGLRDAIEPSEGTPVQ
jgi:hypothetical protein